jgi:hypothetical protein
MLRPKSIRHDFGRGVALSWLEKFVEKVAEHALTEHGAIRQAPFTFAACVFVLGLIIWSVLDWRDSGIIASRDATIMTKDSTISLLKTQVDSLHNELAMMSNLVTPPGHVTELRSRPVPSLHPLVCGERMEVSIDCGGFAAKISKGHGKRR